MRFPGSKLLSKDLSTNTAPFDSVIRNCEEVNLSGYMEITFGDAEGLILFYLGEQINVIYRMGQEIFVSNQATMKLRNTAQTREGKVSIYELPLDMAHMLRGLSNRQEIFGQIFAVDPLKDLITQLEKDGHTGSLEVITNKGNGMILLVRGRFSSGYFETEAGNTFEKGEALNKIYEALEQKETSARVFKSEFSPDIWKSRHETRRARKSRLHDILEQQRPQEAEVTTSPTSGPGTEKAPKIKTKVGPPVKDPKPLQRKILTEIRQQAPSILAAFFFNMETEEIEVDLVEAPSETENRLIIDKLPAFVKYLENLSAMRSDDHIETLTMGTENFYLMVKCIPETGEGLALITDKSQPATLASALLLNSSNRYVLMMSGITI
jgi:hypothetical protein